ncbi:MAG: insulinase family protein [Paludibacteraceae bacterium]|nr:insulinase family protein [Paludibacteraceae bacterium]
MLKRFLFIISGALIGLTAMAQDIQPLPMDPDVRYGVLDNGLTYYIRHNEQPKQRAEFHIAQAVGAILEEDSQNGLAHFLEHMAFNGTTHFHGKGIIDYFKSIGVSFGGDINAYTALDETVYRLSNVPTVREGIIDSALLVLHDWSCDLLLEGDEIDAERGVIREEWRTRSTAQRRMWSESNKQMYAGSQYAKRDVIGDTAVINNFPYDTLRAYYHKWYGPDLQAIIVVGDIDVDQIEQKIKTLFGPIKERPNRGVRPIYSYGQNTDPIISIVTDPEAQYARIALTYKHEPMPKAMRLSQVGFMAGLFNQVVRTVLGYRFSEMTQKPDCNFIQGGGGYNETDSKGDATFSLYVIPKRGHEAQAMNDLLLMAQSLKQYGITSSEYERAKTDLLNMLEKAYNERDNRTNIQLTQECIRHFLDDELMPGISMEYQMSKAIAPQLPVTIVNQLISEYVSDSNLIVSLQGSTDADLPTAQQVRTALKDAQTAHIEAPVEERFDQPLISKAPKAGKIKSTKQNAALGTTEWTLSNGTRVILKPTTYKSDEVLLYAYSRGGMARVKTADLYSAGLASDIVEYNGLGSFSNTQLQKLLTGKTVSTSTAINNYSETLSASSSVKDMESMFQLIYLTFTAVRQDDEAYQTLTNMLSTALQNKSANPKAVFNDSITLNMSGHSPRTLTFNAEDLSKVDQQTALRIFGERYASPSDFIFFITGNISPDDDALRTAVCTYLGSIKAGKTETFTDDGQRTPRGHITSSFTRPMSTHQTSNFVLYTAPMDYTLNNRLNLRVLAECLSARYLESIREREGGSYGVGVRGSVSEYPVAEASLYMQFDTDPEKEERLLKIIHDELAQIAKDGPLDDDMNKAKENLQKVFVQNQERNNFWNSTILYRYYIEQTNYLTDYLPAVQAVSAASVQAAAKALIEAGNVIEVIMAPEL